MGTFLRVSLPETWTWLSDDNFALPSVIHACLALVAFKDALHFGWIPGEMTAAMMAVGIEAE